MNAITEQFTRKKALEEAEQEFRAQQQRAQGNYDVLSQVPAIAPQSAQEAMDLQRAGYIQGGQDPNARSYSPTAFVTPERMMMGNEQKFQDYKANQAYDDYQETLNNPLANLGDTALDIANNTIGLPFKAFGTELFNNPSEKARKRYEQSLEDISTLHGVNQEHYLDKRRERDKAFSDSRSGGTTPSSVREWEYFQNILTPEQRPQYLAMKRGVDRFNLGDRFVTSNAAGDVLSELPINLGPDKELDYLAEAAKRTSAGTTAGKFIAEAKTLYPAMNEKQKELDKTVNFIKNHKGLDAGTGLSTYLDVSNYTPGTEAYNFRTYAKQAQGKVFEAAYDSLKGGGTITEFETQAMADAMARMDTATSKEEYLKAVDDFVSAQKRGLDLTKLASSSTDLDDYLDNYKIFESRKGTKGGSNNTNNKAEEGATATHPETGQRLIFRGGKWVIL